MKRSFDPAAVEKAALHGVKPFQRATIERVDALFRNGQRRVLVADEVGLGKTIVARGVIAKMARLRKEEGDNLFKVAYICANQNIIRQNLAKLDIDGALDVLEEDADGVSVNHRDWTGSRLSMLPLLVESQERMLSEAGRFIQVVPITPETSFRMGSRRGLAAERALVCSMLRAIPGFSKFKTKLLHRLRGGENIRKERWLDLVEHFDKQVRKTIKSSPSFLSDFESDFREAKGEDVVNRLLERRPESDSGDEIRELRQIFAEIGAKHLRPDLVILDEFQRFRYLIDKDDGGEVKILFKRFLRNDTEKDPPRVLMLSATPFKLYSTQAENANSGTDESYGEFKGLLEFLFGANDGNVWREWKRYTTALSLSDFAAGAEEALSAKQQAEEALRHGICRTERTLVEPPEPEPGQPGGAVLPDQREIRSFLLYSKWAKAIGSGNRLRVEYAKSVPYLLSFLTGYQEQDKLESILEQNQRGLAAVEARRARKTLWLDRATVGTYRKLEWANKRLEMLAAQAFAETESFRPERLLWIPPTMPCYPLAGPFACSAGYSKVLVFSAWQMVPKMAAVLLSYETERRTIAALRRRSNYFAKKRFPAPRLQFKSKGRNSMATLTLFTLLYPSKTLSDIFSAVKARNAGVESAESVAEEIAQTIRSRLDKYPNPSGGRVDSRWYYLAPMFLDGPGESPQEAIDWCDIANRVCYNRIKRRNTQAEERSVLRCIDKLRIALRDGKDTLGRRPKDLCKVLANMALGSPAVCMRRAGADVGTATRVAEAFRAFFNSPEAIAAVELSSAHNDNLYWKNVLRYGRDGCLQSVLDEYLHMLSPEKGASDADVAEKIGNALSFRSVPYRVDSFEALRDRVSPGGGGDSKMMPMRAHFAAAFAEGDGDGEKIANRVESLRDAFNSPFRPFVLASTSIGQEGLDFHWYCRKVFHWNLPHNPVDLEQREGRVDRYRGLAVRQNVAEQFKDKRDFREDLWKELFEAAEKAADDPSGLIPNWRNGPDARWKVERIVPLYSCSIDESRYATLVDLLARFRVALGQPRQEELLNRIKRAGIDWETLRRFFLDLCPFSFKRMAYACSGNPKMVQSSP